jgi:chaperonin GroEL (HSP60 family)
MNRKLSYTKNPKIIESSYMKRQILITATEAANSILRINDVYHGKSK